MNTAARISFLLLKHLQVEVTRTGVQKIYSHAKGAPSLYSIGRHLSYWKVEHICLEVEKDRFDELPLPFLAHIKGKRNLLLLVTALQKGKVVYYNEQEKKQGLLLAEFLTRWSGHVLLAEKTGGAGEKDYERHLKEERKERVKKLSMPFAFLLFCLTAWMVNGSEIWLGSLIFIKLAGCAVSLLLLIMESDRYHPLSQTFCSGDQSSCHALVKDQKLSWSTIGLIYFMGGLFSLLLGDTTASLVLNSWLAGLSILFIPYSLYYQARVAKVWCPLCLTVLALLLTESLIAYLFYWRHQPDTAHPFHYVLSGLPSLLLTIVIALLLKSWIQAQAGSKRYHRQANKFKYDPDVFKALLTKEKKVEPPHDMGIITGPADAACTIIQVCHPYCRPCAAAHETIAALIKEQPQMRLQIIFNVTTHADDPSSVAVARFLSREDAEEIMSDWYEEGYRDLKSFIKKYPVTHPEEQRPKIEAMNQWCMDNGIEATPTLFINGYQLPPMYQANDLRYVINESIFVATTGVCV